MAESEASPIPVDGRVPLASARRTSLLRDPLVVGLGLFQAVGQTTVPLVPAGLASLSTVACFAAAVVATGFSPSQARAQDQGERIVDVKVEGNRAVQPEAVKGLMTLRAGGLYDAGALRTDIKAIFGSGFFQDVRVDAQRQAGGLVLVVRVVEKPSIREITFRGFEAVSESSLADKIQVKRYTIVDERKITGDLRVIEQQYVEKGYYLARASYQLEPTDSGEVVLVYRVIENNPVSVGKVNILGNSWFSDGELKAGMATREKRWTSFLNNAGTFKDEFVNRDKEWLAYQHRDNGFAEATVAAPQSRLDTGRQNVEVSYYVEEGERFDVGPITFTGDVIFPLEEIRGKLQLKQGALFRISQFQNDLRILSDMYGDEGYAFADIVPKTSANRQTRIIDIEYAITKKEKAYFRDIVIEGNTKTRDNVIRRNVRVTEGERFHATRLDKSKENIERLGYFQEVQIAREPDEKNNRMDLRVKIKEKSTGQLSASIGASPSADGRDFNFFAQGQYSEANLIGKGWNLGVTASLTPNGSYGLSSNVTEPSINDGPWSVSFFGNYDYQVSEPFKWEGKRYTTIKKLGTRVGREIFVEDLRFNLGYSYEWVTTNDINPVLRPFTKVGETERVSQGLSYDKTNNYLQPTSGFALSLTNTLGLKLLEGQHQFGLIEGSAAYYIPLPITDEYLTNFRFAFEPAYVYPINKQPIPYWERLRLGSFLNMKAYADDEKIISPMVDILVSPDDERGTRRVDKGGNRRLYWTGEYFFPIIPEANLRLVTFGEAGTVLDDREHFEMDKMKYDVGFGFRWLTPIAPFRFEWAWPVEKGGKIGESQFIFFIGNDNASSLSN